MSPYNDVIGALKGKPRILLAKFEINNILYPVIIDTGATISFIPENGAIARTATKSIQEANLNAKLADGKVIHVNKKCIIGLRPYGSRHEPMKSTFYINRCVSKILGYEALLGLNSLRLFNLNIDIVEGKVRIYHDNKLIGYESELSNESYARINPDDRFNNLKFESDIIKLLKRYKSVFTDIDREPIRGRPMRIITTHLRPIHAKQRHYNPEETKQMKHHIKDLLDKGIIEPTNSGYAATSRIIPKKSGAGRLVVNYIPLNAVTIRDSYSTPHVTDILCVLQGNRYFTTMDCSQGFYQILVDHRDRHKTGFSTPIGNFQFIRCPFGARNSCAYFQSEMNRIFADGLFTRCMIYVDDILIFGKTRQEHDDNLQWVLSKCKEFNVKLKLEKCNFAQNEVEYLGFSITGQTIKPLKSKVDSLILSKSPKDKSELRSIIGKLNFYSRFISNFSKDIEPLRELFRKNKDFQWKDYHQQAYKRLIESLEKAPVQYLIAPTEHKIIELKVLENSFEAILMNDEENLMHRTSRLLSSAESNYSLVELYLSCLVMAVNKFRIWLKPNKFSVRMPIDHLDKTLKLVNKPERVDNLLLRMPIGFDEFIFDIKGELTRKQKKRPARHTPEEIYYIDGACKGNGKPDCQASWAICAEYDKSIEKTGLIKENPSNNTAELTAAIEACLLAKEKGQSSITIVTDSRYLHSAATVWIDKWKTNEWLDHKRKKVVNVQLFKRLLDAKKDLQIEWIHVRGHGDNIGNIRADNLARAQLEQEYGAICHVISQPVCISYDGDREIDDLKTKIRSGQAKDFTIYDNKIYYIDRKLPEGDCKRIYVPKKYRKELLRLAHDNPLYGGHLGIKKTHRKLISYWWPKMHQDVELYIKTCEVCQKFKNEPGIPKGYLHSIPVSSIFEHVHLDIIGPILSTYRGNKYIITATDAFSKWAFAKPVQSILTADLINFVESKIFAVHGKPECIITDRGAQFTSKEWKEFVEDNQFDHRLTTPYHPQSNGIDERVNGTLIRILRTYVDDNHSDWDFKLKWALYLYNTTVHESTGMTPYQIMFGKDHRSPLKNRRGDRINLKRLDKIRDEIRRSADEMNAKAQEKQKRSYDKHKRSHSYDVGDFIMIRNQIVPQHKASKFYPKWLGPYIIIDIIGDNHNPKAFKILDLENRERKTVAVCNIKPYYDRNNNYNENSTLDSEDDVSNTQREDLCSPGYYCSDTSRSETELIDKITPPRIVPNHNLSLWRGDVPDGLRSSSPRLSDRNVTRRVTISDDVETINYEKENSLDLPDETTEIYNHSNKDNGNTHRQTQVNLIDFDVDQQSSDNVQGSSDIICTEPENIESNNTNEVNNDTQEDQQPYVSPYLCEFIIDNSRSDPTFKQASTKIQKSDRVTRSMTRQKQSVPTTQNEATSSDSPRTSLIPVPTRIITQTKPTQKKG